MRPISKRSQSAGRQNAAKRSKSTQPPRNQRARDAVQHESLPQPSARLRRSIALSAELDRFLEEVFDAVSAAMTARRWQDLGPLMEAYAASLTGITAASLFHAAIAHRIACHALTVSDRDALVETLDALRSELRLAHAPPPLADTISQYMTALRRRDALDAFAALTLRSTEEVH